MPNKWLNIIAISLVHFRIQWNVIIEADIEKDVLGGGEDSEFQSQIALGRPFRTTPPNVGDEASSCQK